MTKLEKNVTQEEYNAMLRSMPPQDKICCRELAAKGVASIIVKDEIYTYDERVDA
jgi:D-aminopeptidase